MNEEKADSWVLDKNEFEYVEDSSFAYSKSSSFGQSFSDSISSAGFSAQSFSDSSSSFSKSVASTQSASSVSDNYLGFSVGGAKNSTSYRENIKNNYFPLETDITYLKFSYCS